MQQHLVFNAGFMPLMIFVDRVLQRPTSKKTHRIERFATFLVATKLIDRDDARMLQAAGDLRFAAEVLKGDISRLRLAGQFLYSYVAVQVFVACQPDRPKPPLTELTKQCVACPDTSIFYFAADHRRTTGNPNIEASRPSGFTANINRCCGSLSVAGTDCSACLIARSSNSSA